MRFWLWQTPKGPESFQLPKSNSLISGGKWAVPIGTDFAPAQHRRNLLMALAEALCKTPNAGVPIRTQPPEPLAELRSTDVIRDKELGHSVVFTHDIYEEWALCEYLVSRQSDVSGLLKAAHEPDILIRPVQLFGAYVLETNASPEPWKALLTNTADSSLRPVWQRSVLTSCLQSTQTTQNSSETDRRFVCKRRRAAAQVAVCNDDHRGAAKSVIS